MQNYFSGVFIVLTTLWLFIIIVTIHTVVFEKKMCKKVFEQTGENPSKMFWKRFYRKWGIWIFDNIKLLETYNDMRRDMLNKLSKK